MRAPGKSKNRKGRASGPGPTAEPASELERAKGYCLRLLSYRLRSEQELRRALERRGVSPAVRQSCLQRLQELGLVNDQEFARAWVESRLSGSIVGRNRLLAGLSRLGVDKEIASEAVAALAPDAAQAEHARELASRRLGTGLLDQKAKGRLARLLVGRGFSPAVAYQVVRGLEREGH